MPTHKYKFIQLDKVQITNFVSIYQDCVTRRGIVVIASQYCSMCGMISSSLLKKCFTFPFLCTACCKLAMAVIHICGIAGNCKIDFNFINLQIQNTEFTYKLDIFENFPIRLASNFCKWKCNSLRMELICPIESQYMIHETISRKLRKAILKCLNCGLCHCKNECKQMKMLYFLINLRLWWKWVLFTFWICKQFFFILTKISKFGIKNDQKKILFPAYQ